MPMYSATTERIYSRLPEMYQTIDANNDMQFKKYISSIGDELNAIDTLIARILKVPVDKRSDFLRDITSTDTYERPSIATADTPTLGLDDMYYTSDLVDARTCNPEWLPYLANLFGVRLPDSDTLTQRSSIVYFYRSYRAGIKDALINAVKDLLTGSKYLALYDHHDGAGSSLSSLSNEWHMLLVTKPEETPIGLDLPAEVAKRGGKPAGVILHHVIYTMPWSTLESGLTTWAGIEALGTWDALEHYGS